MPLESKIPESERLEQARQQLATMTLPEQVAQRLIVGLTPNSDTNDWQNNPFFETGIGGFIFFQRDFKSLKPDTALGVANLLTELRNRLPQDLPIPFLSIDQEGGLVEHLPPHVFPSLVSPMAVGKRVERNKEVGVKNPTEYVAEVYDLMAYYLNMLGFNTNFGPVLDVHGHVNNPVIGVRAFSDDPQAVIECAKIASERFNTRGLMAVGKHFPGHGYSALDSHISKPTLPITDAEQQTFKWAVEAKLDALMVAHAHYPDWQPNETCPASLSRHVVTDTLRNAWGYTGIIMTDDMHMGGVTDGVTEGLTPEQAAIQAVQAGNDMLIYRFGGEMEQRVHQALCDGIESGDISRDEHEAAVLRVLMTKLALPQALPNLERVEKIMIPAAIDSVSSYAVEGGIAIQDGRSYIEGEALPPFCDPEDLIGMIAPDLNTIPLYKEATLTLPTLGEQLNEKGIFPIWETYYPLYKDVVDAMPWPDDMPTPNTVIWVTYHPFDQGYVSSILEKLAQYDTSVKLVLVHANLTTPSERLLQITDTWAVVVYLLGYRQGQQKTLIDQLTEPTA